MKGWPGKALEKGKSAWTYSQEPLEDLVKAKCLIPLNLRFFPLNKVIHIRRALTVAIRLLGHQGHAVSSKGFLASEYWSVLWFPFSRLPPPFWEILGTIHVRLSAELTELWKSKALLSKKSVVIWFGKQQKYFFRRMLLKKSLQWELPWLELRGWVAPVSAFI